MGKHSADKCEMPGCKVQARRGDKGFCFVSYAVNPKTKEKGMLLCPKHEAEVVARGY